MEEKARLHERVKDEKSKPENEGRNVVYNARNRSVMVDDVIIDRFKPLFL